MDGWLIWLIVGVVLIMAEMATFTFYLLWLGIGALVAAIVASIAPDSLPIQIILGGVVAVVLTVYSKTVTRKVRQSVGFNDEINQLVGKHGEVIEPITPGMLGIVKIGNETWSASSDEEIAAGERVIVEKRRTTVVEVKKVEG